MPGSRFGTFARSISTPVPPRLAVSQVEQVNPAAPMSWMPATASVARSSRQASSKSFSRKGSPTCTAGRSSLLSSVRSREAVAGGLGADVEDGVADALGRAAGDLLVAQHAEAEYVHQRVAIVAFVEI